MRKVTPLIRQKTLITLELTEEQAAALRRVVKAHNTTANAYALEMVLAGLNEDDEKLSAEDLARCLGLPANTPAARIRAHVRKMNA